MYNKQRRLAVVKTWKKSFNQRKLRVWIFLKNSNREQVSNIQKVILRNFLFFASQNKPLKFENIPKCSANFQAENSEPYFLTQKKFNFFLKKFKPKQISNLEIFSKQKFLV